MYATKPGKLPGPSAITSNAGDIVWLQFNPQTGHEQAGHRPALVLSPAAYNAKTGLMLCCPLSPQIKGYPFEVMLDGKKPSVVLADQLKSLDWQTHKARLKGKVKPAELAEVHRKAIALIGMPLP